MKIAIAQINATAGDIEGNACKIMRWTRKARRAGAGLVVFPAAALTGRPIWDLCRNMDFIKRSRKAFENLSREMDEPACLLGGYPLRCQAGAGAALIHKRKIAAKTAGTLVPLRFDDSHVQIAKSSPQFLADISASSYHMGVARQRFEKLRRLARKKRLPIVYCNMAGGGEELIFDGNSLAIDAGGNLLARGKSFEENLTVVDFDSRPAPMSWQDIPCPEELYLALTLGIRDYVRKCGFKRVVLGLSGGIDSAVVCSLASSALGPANVTGVFMPSRYTSGQSLRDAGRLASNLRIHYVSIPISAIYNSYLKELRPYTSRGLSLSADTAEENIQARVRANILMALSNKYGWLVLSCGNKSESAMGYCTLYGDMSGGLAPLSDVLKTTVYELAGYINREKTIIPQATIERAPTAELKANQKDSDDLPPYEKLDPIIRAYVEENKPPGDIIVPGFSRDMISSVIDRIDRNEYKRRQAPPGLKVTTKAFGIGRKMPIIPHPSRLTPNFSWGRSKG